MDKGLMEFISKKNVFAGRAFADEPMEKHTTLRIGGPAEMFAVPDDVSSCAGLLTEAVKRGMAVMPVGGGSNLLVADEGIAGLVLSVASFNYIDMLEESDEAVRLSVGSGTPLQRLVNLSRDKGYSGMEGLAGIPGFTGGAVRGNAGSFGCEMGNVVESVSAVDKKGGLFILEKDALNFSYRSSSISDGLIITEATIRLTKGDAKEVAGKINDVLREKLERQPISERSAGCVFRNPAGDYAARLIDEARCKGMRRGDIEVSVKHANFFINKGNGKALDFIALMEDVRERVMKLSGIELEPEINIAGRINQAKFLC